MDVIEGFLKELNEAVKTQCVEAFVDGSHAEAVMGSTKEDGLEGVGRWEATQMLRPPPGCDELSCWWSCDSHTLGAINSRQISLTAEMAGWTSM